MEIRAKNDRFRRILQAASDGDIHYLQSVEDSELRTSVCTSGCTVLHWAAGTNQVSVLKYLIEDRQLPVDTPAVKKSKGRTPLHYSCRNGSFEATQFLIQDCKAEVNPRAKHGVTPFQLAVWQNQLQTCQYLVDQCGVDPCQVNDFDCGAIHWLGTCPTSRANMEQTTESEIERYEDGSALLPLAEWLAEQPGLDYTATQRQGHSALHKASWGGHLALIKYLRNEHGLWDDSADEAGNYAADLADMAQTPRHYRIARYLREECSRARAESCATLGVDPTASRDVIRKAYLVRARRLHPDRNRNQNSVDDAALSFDALRKAYNHLMEENGYGNQSNPSHSLNLMLQVSGLQETEGEDPSISDSSCFKARLIAVLLEYGDKGLDLSNVKRKWKQVWPKEPFPNDIDPSTNRRIPLSQLLRTLAGDAIDLVHDGSGMKVCPKHCSKHMVKAQAAKDEIAQQ
eukprot:scaffold4844_cov112-Cylindrotheca_fusiformis.AAC.5